MDTLTQIALEIAFANAVTLAMVGLLALMARKPQAPQA